MVCGAFSGRDHKLFAWSRLRRIFSESVCLSLNQLLRWFLLPFGWTSNDCFKVNSLRGRLLTYFFKVAKLRERYLQYKKVPEVHNCHFCNTQPCVNLASRVGGWLFESHSPRLFFRHRPRDDHSGGQFGALTLNFDVRNKEKNGVEENFFRERKMGEAVNETLLAEYYSKVVIVIKNCHNT